MEYHLVAYAPAYNIGKNAAELLERMGKAAKGLAEAGVSLDAFVIVNDGSTDDTKTLIEKASRRRKTSFARIVSKERNEGPVRALFDAMEEAMAVAHERGFAPEKTIMARMDSDLEHQPEDLKKLVEPIISGRAIMAVGYVPFDERSGKECMEFNARTGLEESRKFLGADIPQFCPGFNAIRLDAFAKVHSELVAKARKYQKETSEDMLGMDFVELVIAKSMGWQPEVVRLMPIEDRFMKRPSPEKLKSYESCHEKTMGFLGKEYTR